MIAAGVLGVSIALQLAAIFQVTQLLNLAENRFYGGTLIAALTITASLDGVFLYFVTTGEFQSSFTALLSIICLVKSILILVLLFWLAPKIHSLGRSGRIYKARSERYRTVLDNTPDMLAFKDRQGVYVTVNPAFCRFWGKDSQSLIGKTDFDILPREQAGQFQEKDAAVMQAQVGTSHEAEVTAVGGRRIVQFTRVPVRSDGGVCEGILVAGRDITDTRHLEDSWSHELMEKTNQLEVLRRQIQVERLVGAISTHFIHIEHGKVEREVNRALQTIVELGGIDAGFILLLAEGGQGVEIPYQWHRLETVWKVEGINQMPLNGAPWWVGKHNRFDILHLTQSEKNLELQDAQNYIQSQGIKSFTATPLIVGRSVIGYLGFVSLHEEKQWSRDMLALFKLMAEMFVNVLRRKWDADKSNETNKKFNAWITKLEQRNRESALVSEMENLLLVCRTVDEAYPIIGRYCKRLFPTVSGALYVLEKTDQPTMQVACWGEKPPPEHEIAINECWGLRRGREHLVVDATVGPHCRHLGTDKPSSYLCLPLIAQGQILGLLHLRSEPLGVGPQTLPEPVQKLAESVAEYIALALSNLALKNTLLIQAIRDPLTGLFNRRYMEETLERELHRASRYGTPVGVLMFDMDEFKIINDAFGHDAGDLVLKAIGDLLAQFFRGEDVACRFGGDEFTIILPESSLADTWQRAEQLREEWKKVKIKYEGNFLRTPTLSIGVAAFPEHGMKPEQLLQVADTAAYTAKSKGKDRVMLGVAREG
jgi:diguanylate cyclase (GGDEF)-like protein/PAS domain S-box-containing protein